MKRFFMLALSFAIILLMSNASRGAERTYVLKFNTVAGPQQPQIKALEVFAREVDKLSGGKIKVQIFHSGQLGNQQTQLIGVMRGTLDMTFASPNSLAQFDRRLGIFGSAYLFRDLGHLRKVMNGDIGKEYFDRLAANQGLRPLDVWYLGTRQLNLRNRGVRTPEEMKGIKLRVPNSPLWIAMGRALGANPTPIGFGEVYLALKTGVVDGQDNPLPTNKAQKFYEVTKYIVMTGHQIGMVWPSINEKLWKEMPENYRAWVTEAMRAARQHHDGLVIDGEARLLDEFQKEHGLTVIYPDVEAFRKNARSVYADFEEEWGKGMYERIRAVK